MGSPNSESGLHIDSRATRFWMALLAGTKVFRFIKPTDLAALRLREDANPNVFHTDADLWRPHSSLENLEVLEAEMKAGDIIYIPEGTFGILSDVHTTLTHACQGGHIK